MAQHTTAVFENGCLTPLKALHGIPDHSVVKITVEAVVSPGKRKQLAMLRAVPLPLNWRTPSRPEGSGNGR